MFFSVFSCLKRDLAQRSIARAKRIILHKHIEHRRNRCAHVYPKFLIITHNII
jgi:hypothetical protein